MRRAQHHPPPHSRDRWLLSYADFMTLLFAFFTTLYAASLLDAKEQASVVDGLRSALGGGTVVTGASPTARTTDVKLPAPPRPEDLEAAADRVQIGEARQAIERELGAAVSLGQMQLVEDRRGLVIGIPEAASFATGRAELSEVAIALMHRLSTVLKTLPNAIRIEGHTDDAPIRTAQFASNWELSTARATRVVAFLVARRNRARRVCPRPATGEFHPRAPNTSPESRATQSPRRHRRAQRLRPPGRRNRADPQP